VCLPDRRWHRKSRCRNFGHKGPNGLAFSPDERTLYIVEGRETPRRLLAFEVIHDGSRLGKRRIFAVADDNGALDGFRCDEDGNLWCGWGMGSAELDGVVVFSPTGERIGRIDLPERCENLCFGGRRRNRLFMAASQSLYSLYVNTRGCR
jgi:gluconolactonase